MKNAPFFLLIFLMIACSPETATDFADLNGDGSMQPYENPDLSADERADDILSRLSVQDKVNLVVGVGFNIPGMYESIQELRVPGAVGGTFTFDSLGIRGLLTTDGPAGVRIMPIEGTDTYYCTAFPIASLVSSTWDQELAYEIGSAIGNEVKEYGMDILLAPALNIHRDPRAGRNFEYYSEDPLLSGKMTASVVNGVQSHGVGTSVKHYAANNQETNRNIIDVIVSERALREIYLKGFEIAIKESNPWTVMSAYNQVNGAMASENEDLLTTVLRDEWGFDGFVMTDWFAGQDAAAQMRAGNDLLMPGTPEQRQALMEAVESGSLDEAILDRNAKRILKILLNSPSFNHYDYSNEPDLDAHAQLAREVAAEGTVLLKNDGTLPLNPDQLQVGAFGIGSYDFIAGGTGSGDVVEAYTVSLVEGLENADIAVQQDLKQAYRTYLESEREKAPEQENLFMPPPVIPERPLTELEVSGVADATDIALITLGRLSGEFQDRPLDGDFYLTEAEQDMISTISDVYHAQGKKVVMILNIGNVIEMASWRDKVDAIVLPWQGGQEAGNAVVDVLTGVVNPSGKLPSSFPLTYDDVPSSDNFPGEEIGEPFRINELFEATPSRVIYEEGIYVGYRYYTTFGKEVAYPFGYGMTYTSFEYDNASVSGSDGTINVSVSVTNSGDVSGREVVQVYVSAPGQTMDKPEMELRAFGKTGTLEAGASEELTFTIEPKDYAAWDTERAAWVVEPGTYEVRIGASSEDIRATGTFEVAGEIIVEELSNALTPERQIDELTSGDE